MVAALLGSTAFDSFANTSFWITTVQSSGLTTVAWGTLGLLAMIAIVLATFSLAAAWMGRSATGRPLRTRCSWCPRWCPS